MPGLAVAPSSLPELAMLAWGRLVGLGMATLCVASLSLPELAVLAWGRLVVPALQRAVDTAGKRGFSASADVLVALPSPRCRFWLSHGACSVAI